MEAIDDYANENIIRSIAYTALEQRQQHNYAGLLPIASQLLRQRAHFLGSDKAMQWQEDNCPAMIESLWSSGGSVADELYQKPVYYKRMDADTLHAVIEFAESNGHHFVVVLLLEDGSGDISDIKYYNTKELTKEEWMDIFENWSRTIEDAERIYLTKVTRNKRVFSAGTPDSSKDHKEAPEDYWGEWSSDEGSSQHPKETTHHRNHPLSADLKESDDSEDEYYTRWSKDPGTLTPGPEDKLDDPPSKRTLKTLSALQQQEQQEEWDEEYDQSYNPLFTVPSVPNLMDAHTAALSELTHMLQNTLPQQRTANRPFVVQPMTQINPLPKAVSRLKSNMEDLSVSSEEPKVPGAYPESGTQTPGIVIDSKSKEVGRGLFMKSLSALIGAARLLGYEGKDILEMVQEIVNNP